MIQSTNILIGGDSTFIDETFVAVSKHCYLMHNRRACIYTGDADLNITKIEDIYNNIWMNVGTVQISHHGHLSSLMKAF